MGTLYVSNNVYFALYCFGRKFVKVLTQDSALLYGVIPYVRAHYDAG